MNARASTWLWLRTRIEQPSPDVLVVTAWNVERSGGQHLATEARYTRA